MLKLDENKYIITEKIYNGIKIRELKPIKTPEQDKKDREHTTKMCINILERYHKL